jgi:uncharacterized circularly permuted ATP-grasp superfamily protein
VPDLLADYGSRPRAAPAYDEMVGTDGRVRRAYRAVNDALALVSAQELESRAAALAAAFTDRGVTFAVAGDDDERPFPLDLVPRVLSADEWDVLDRGVQQRVRALEAFLADVYDAGRIFAEGVMPRRLPTSSRHFHRAAHGVAPPNGVRIHVAGIDLVRDSDGEFRVLEDNVRVPSGVSYVIENRQALARVLPDLMAAHQLQPVSDYPTRLLAALRAAAPEQVTDPTVVVLTPGSYNSAYFEHSLLARLMGVELVEGRDLHCRSDEVFMHTTAGEQQVHVIYRRIDDEFIDPLHFRPDSVVGCAGLLNAVRAGNVTLANAVGNGVADDKLTYTYVPDMVRFYLGEEPILPNVETFRLEDPEQRQHVLDRLDELVLKPVDESGGYGIVIGPMATKRQLALARKEVLAAPRRWIAQPVVALSTVPTFVDAGLAPRHVDLRPFAINDGNSIWVLPGGLTRVALQEGRLIVNSSQGGGSKDTWVLARSGRRGRGEARVDGPAPARRPEEPMPALAAPQEQQQQQGRTAPC